MQPEELLRTARAKARELPPPTGPREAVLERLRTGCALFFAKVPEPPVYLRLEDPLLAQAAALRDEGAGLLSVGLAFLRDTGEEREARELLEALESHLGVLCHLAEGRLSAAESAWVEARAREHHALSARRKWKRSDERIAVYDPATGRSRYDPRERADLDVRLCCPHCRQADQYRFTAASSEQRLVCPRCRTPFLAFFGELRSVAMRVEQGRRSYAVELEELTGPVSRAEFEDAGAAVLSLTRGDFVALAYTMDHALRCVQNLSTGRLLWISRGGPCFVASVAFGPQASELEDFRRFRDEVLLRSAGGRWAVGVYYEHGPRAARWVQARPVVLRGVRWGLSGVHRMISRETTT